MYLQYFGLTEPPFSITPDPAFVYLSAAHRDALAHLLYGVGQGAAGGFVQLTGEVGTGKTTICRCVLEQVPENTRVALILNPMVTPRELLDAICDELGVSVDGPGDSTKARVDALNDYLLEQHAAGNRVVVIIDEAQNLSPEALEQVRLLTNLETAKNKLLQIVLLGQPELRQLLQRRNLRQLAQRITARYHLAPLGSAETVAYVRHRMQVAGAPRNPFTRAALRALHRRSGGVPRLINIIADRALAAAYAGERTRVGARLVQAAADEVQPSEGRVNRRRWPMWVAAGAVVAGIGILWAVWGLPGIQPFGAGHGSVTAAAEAPPDEAGSTIEESPNQDRMSAVGATRSEDGASDSLAATGFRAPGTLPATGMDPAWIDRQHDRAFAGLAELWGGAGGAEAIRAACGGIQGAGYACLRDSGNWSRVLHLGLPVILVLNDRGGRRVLLRGVAANQVLLGDASDTRLVGRSEVEARWLGEYFIAWPQAPDWPLQIRRGESGPAVDIVLRMAELADPPWHGSDHFNADFEAWLLAFQRNNGLTADGIIGPKTLLYLLAPGVEEPRLLTSIEKDF
ncbi:AAA family ATPase [Elongatibacter sediminis]|uniref:AAA family ATPase n=1 Tax=Elongatibacter sediminis TaxID=3119006 RepID=A0AAW9RIM3_9GAMM